MMITNHNPTAVPAVVAAYFTLFFLPTTTVATSVGFMLPSCSALREPFDCYNQPIASVNSTGTNFINNNVTSDAECMDACVSCMGGDNVVNIRYQSKATNRLIGGDELGEVYSCECGTYPDWAEEDKVYFTELCIDEGFLPASGAGALSALFSSVIGAAAASIALF